MDDIFKEVKLRVTARAAAELYGYQPNRAGFILCPFHAEKSASLKLYDTGNFHCFGCGAGGDSIDFTARLHGLTPLEAVKKLDADFHLSLPLGSPATPQEREKARREIARRAGLDELHRAFEDWRNTTIRELNECIRLGNLVERYMDKPDNLSPLAALALRERERMEYLADTLMWGSPEEQAQIWADRKEVNRWTEAILNGC